MAEPVIAKPRRSTAAAVLGVETLSAFMLTREETATTAASTSVSAGAVPTTHVLRDDAPASVVLSRWSGSLSPGKLQQSLRTESNDLKDDKGGETGRECSTERRQRNVVVQHSPIKADSGSHHRRTTRANLPNGNAPYLSPPVSGMRETSLMPHSAAKQPFFSNMIHRAENVQLHRLCEGLFADSQKKGDKNGGRCTARRRFQKNNVEVDLEGDGGKDAAPTTTLHSPLSLLRLIDLERPNSKGGQLSVRPSAARTKHARVQHKVVNLSLCKYPLLRAIAEEKGFKTQESEEELEKNQFNLVWSDTVLPLTRLVRLASWQRTNHFPAMHLLCRKGHLGITLGRMRKLFPTHYTFYPRTWSLRSERHQFQRFMMALRNKKVPKFFIMKPNAGCQGRGILITRDPLNAVDDVDNYIVQEYIARPILLEERKFDLRVYVLLTSIRAPSIFLFNDGLVRLCAEPYEKPTDSNARNTCKHLTNYAVNKHSPEYVFNDNADSGNVGNKRNFKFLNEWLDSSGNSSEVFWSRVAHVICKTILVAQPQIANVYNSCFPRQNDGYNCFEVLGFDILIDHQMKPWLMEVNHTPSFATDTPLDYEIKHALLEEVLDIIDVRATDRRRGEKKEREEFVQRVMRKPVGMAASAHRGGGGGGGASEVMSSSPSTSSLFQVQQPYMSTTGSMGTLEQAAEFAKLIEERRAHEDSKLCGFRRIYPTQDAEHQLVYDAVLSQACAQCTSPQPSWMSSPTPSSPQVSDERHRRMDNTPGSFALPQRLPTSAASTDAGVAISSPHNSSVTSNLSRGMQMQKLREEMTHSRRNGKPAPRVRPVVSSAVRERSGGATGHDNSYTVEVPPPPPPPQLSSSSVHAGAVEPAPEQKRPILERLCILPDADNQPPKVHVIVAKLTPVSTKPAPPDHSTSTAERIEELRNLQEQLEHEAECELSQLQGSDGEDSFTLGE
ncbi:tubulin-tyrosine ligase-like protein [Trypanosoma grayi]|uniref:tubulin-tyrosine ligase-like protein n=1 Tax=Trypanosoma grayi TaxID=71804 RepID=UPI0004F49B7B|nr:tubulin-tyrosine ligase-like protein [Trypanosoma grayi]KEG13682.1 tubulin-tyrosine ligase-like protein [Trypanosoma grayi]